MGNLVIISKNHDQTLFDVVHGFQTESFRISSKFQFRNNVFYVPIKIISTKHLYTYTKKRPNNLQI